jgi:geranylgeranyl diphosphate synthase type II
MRTHAGEPMHDEAAIFQPLDTIERFIEQFLSGHRADRPPALLDAMRYAALGGGKRLRPVLAWWCAVAAGGRGEDALAASCAVELVHAFSLVHDDLPALDNDDLRRGRPTLHKHAGEGLAILTGDQLLVEAFRCVIENAPAHARLALCDELARASSNMVYGQVYDIAGGWPSQLTPRERLELIHRNKTGALLLASCRMGAWSALSMHHDSFMHNLDRYGTILGLLFQAVDDLLDVTQTSHHTGKATGKDAAAGKLTYPALLGVEGTRREIESLREQAFEAARSLCPRTEELQTIANFLARRTN